MYKHKWEDQFYVPEVKDLNARVGFVCVYVCLCVHLDEAVTSNKVASFELHLL